MSDQQREHENEDEMPTSEELEEPSTAKDPEEVPTAPDSEDAEPSHQAVGIGVPDAPQVEPEGHA